MFKALLLGFLCAGARYYGGNEFIDMAERLCQVPDILCLCLCVRGLSGSLLPSR